MKKKLITIKVTETTIKNFNMASAMSGDKQYEVAEEASKDVLKKISTKIKSKNK